MFERIVGIDFQFDTRIPAAHAEPAAVEAEESAGISELASYHHIVRYGISQQRRDFDGMAFRFDALYHDQRIVAVVMGRKRGVQSRHPLPFRHEDVGETRQAAHLLLRSRRAAGEGRTLRRTPFRSRKGEEEQQDGEAAVHRG